MKKINHKSHPYHYSEDKNFTQQLIDWGVPIGLFFLYFQFYNFGKFTPSEMVKTTGLMALSLLSLTLIAGPIARFFSFLNVLKAHRKFWGITSVVFLLTHILLVFIFYFKFNIYRFIDFNNPKATGLSVGLLATGILLLVTFTSSKRVLQNLDPKIWKAIQITSYLALILSIAHFYLMEQVNGILVIKRTLGQITFWFAIIVIIIRLFVLCLPNKKR